MFVRPRTSAMKTLLISANPRMQQRLIEVLKRRQGDVRVVADADSACTALRAAGYPLVILDVGLVGERSVELCRRLRELCENRDQLILAAGNPSEIVGFWIDVTEHRLAVDLLRLQRDLGIALSSTSDLRDASDQLLEAAIQIEGFDSGGVYLVDPHGGDLNLVTHRGVSSAFVKSVTCHDADSPEARLIMAGEPQYYERDFEPTPAMTEAIRREGLSAGAVVPIRHDGQVIASLHLTSHSHKSIPPTARHALEAIAARLGGILARIRVEPELRESEQRYRLIADNATDMIWTATPGGLDGLANLPQEDDSTTVAGELLRRWQFTYVSPSIKRLFGYEVEEALGLKLEDLLPPDSYRDARVALAEELLAEWQEPGRHRLQTLELKHRTKHGALRWVEVTTTFLRNAEKRITGLLGVTRDITQRKQAEQAVRESEAKLRCLFENMPDFVFMVDRQGILRFANRPFTRVRPEELLGTDGRHFLPPEHYEDYRRALNRAFEDREVQAIEVADVFGRWWTARLMPVAGEETVEHVIVIARDITKQKRAAEAVQREQRLLRQLLDLHERDRRLIAYEIHDGFSQQVTAARFNLEAFARMPNRDCDEARKLFNTGLELLSDSIDESRRLISGLRPPILDESGIVAAIDYLVCESREWGAVEIEFSHDVQFDRLAPPLESAIFRIAQESLNNACRHSRSEKVRVELVQHGDRLRVGVRDWGVGFDPAGIEEHRFGLRGIRERARLLGGKVTLRTAPHQGTYVGVELPLIERAEKQAER